MMLLSKLGKAARHFVVTRAKEASTRTDVLAAERYLATILTLVESELARLAGRHRVFDDIDAERERQDRKWGTIERFFPRPDGTDPANASARDKVRDECDRAHERGDLTWRHILDDEVLEALSETDPQRIRAELVQAAAVCVSWIEAIDGRGANTKAASR